MSRVNIEMKGLSELLGGLAAVAKDADEVISDTIAELALTTEATAVAGIRGGAATGRVYKRKGHVHQASSPGQFPASDTGRLMASIASDIAPKEARVGTNLVYGEHLEFGTSQMAPRPWLVPSFEQAKTGVAADLKRRFERSLK